MEMKSNFKKNRHKQIIVATLTLLCVMATLYQFSKTTNKYKREINIQSLKQLAMQSSDIIESELQGYTSFMEKLSTVLTDDDIYSEETMTKLIHYCELSEFQRIGIVDESGYAHITNGDKVNVEDRDFFQEAINGNTFVSNVLESRLVGQSIIAVSTPIYTQDKIKGVVYGIMEVSSMPLLKNGVMETEYRWLDIVDSTGDYIRKSNVKEDIEEKETNIIQSLTNADPNLSIADFEIPFSNHQEFMLQTTLDNQVYYVNFSPLETNQWYVVSIINSKFYQNTASFEFSYANINSVIQIMAIFIIFSAVMYYLYHNEKKYIKELNEYLAYNEEVYRVATTKSDNIVFVYDIFKDELRFINEAFYQNESLTNTFKTILKKFTHQERVQDQSYDFEHPIKSIYDDYETEIRLENEGKNEYYALYISYLSDKQKKHYRCVGTIRNITEEKKKEQQLKIKAQYDSLTGLLNRETGEQKIRNLLQGNKTHAFALIDLDDFKNINDTLGHDYGDQALRDIGDILRRHFRKEDVICRLGGDEFVVLINDIPEDVVLKVMNALINKIQLVYENGDKSVKANISAGIALYPSMGTTFETLYKKADQALYASKENGKGQCCIWKENKDA